MTSHHRSASLAAAAALIITVLTQIGYMVLEASGTVLATRLWQTEAAAFLVLAMAGGVLLARSPLIGSGLLLGGVLNLAQVGMGLTLFDPLEAGGDALAGVFEGVVGFAFFFYFAAKAALGSAGLAIGAHLWRGAAGGRRIVGALAGLTGLAALAANLAAMVGGMGLVFAAGAAGTAAAAALAAGLLVLRGPDQT